MRHQLGGLQKTITAEPQGSRKLIQKLQDHWDWAVSFKRVDQNWNGFTDLNGYQWSVETWDLSREPNLYSVEGQNTTCLLMWATGTSSVDKYFFTLSDGSQDSTGPEGTKRSGKHYKQSTVPEAHLSSKPSLFSLAGFAYDLQNFARGFSPDSCSLEPSSSSVFKVFTDVTE